MKQKNNFIFKQVSKYDRPARLLFVFILFIFIISAFITFLGVIIWKH